MGNTASGSSQGSNIAQVPAWLLPFYKQGGQQAQTAQNWLPSITDLYNQVPQLNVPGITAQQQQDVNLSQNIGPNQAYTQGTGALGQFLGTPGTPSSATSAELKLFKDQLQPQIMQNAVLQGQGNSGAADAAVAQGFESAMVPFMQQDLSNTLQAGTTLGGLGIQQGQLRIQQLQNALQAAGIPPQIAAEQAKALFEQQQQKLTYASGIQTAPISGFGSLIGTIANEVTSSDPGTLAQLQGILNLLTTPLI